MNEGHEQLCSSPEWGEYLATEVLPDVLAGVDLGDRRSRSALGSVSRPMSCVRGSRT